MVLPLRKVIRVADERDLLIVEENKQEALSAFDICQKKVIEHGLDMKLVDVEFTFDRNKVIFYFTADGRVDFRELVKDLASIFKTRIELRQIGVRDEQKCSEESVLVEECFAVQRFLEILNPFPLKWPRIRTCL